MSVLRAPTFSIVVLVTIGLAWPAPSHAIDLGFKAVECAAFLRSAQMGSVILKDAGAGSSDAFSAFHNFKAYLSTEAENENILKRDPFASVFVTSKSKDVTPALARLIGLETQLKEVPEDEDQRVSSYGSIGRGEDALRYFQEEELVRNAFNPPKVGRLLLRSGETLVALFASLSFLSADLWLAQHAPVLGGLAVSAGAVVTVNALLILWKSLYKTWSDIDLRAPKKLATTSVMALTGQPGDWFYRGETYYVDQGFIQWIGKKDILRDEALIDAQIKALSQGRSILPFDPQALATVIEDAKMIDHGLVPARKLKDSDPEKQYRALYIDQLLTLREGEDGTVQPEFSVFVRMSKNKSRIELVETQRSGLRTLVPVRVTNPAK